MMNVNVRNCSENSKELSLTYKPSVIQGNSHGKKTGFIFETKLMFYRTLKCKLKEIEQKNLHFLIKKEKKGPVYNKRRHFL